MAGISPASSVPWLAHAWVPADLRLTQHRTSMPSMSSVKLLLTDTRASCGHAWNQSIAVQLTMAGNFRALPRSVGPTGEKQNTTCGDEGMSGECGQVTRVMSVSSQTMREGAWPATLVSYPSIGHWCKAALTSSTAAPQGRQEYHCVFLKMCPSSFEHGLWLPLRVRHLTCSLIQVT